jgi:hypothetical protein
MPQLLAKVGFPVMADYFDEPEVRQTGNAVISARRKSWLTST